MRKFTYWCGVPEETYYSITSTQRMSLILNGVDPMVELVKIDDKDGNRLNDENKNVRIKISEIGNFLGDTPKWDLTLVEITPEGGAIFIGLTNKKDGRYAEFNIDGSMNEKARTTYHLKVSEKETYDFEIHDGTVRKITENINGVKREICPDTDNDNNPCYLVTEYA